MPWNHHQDDSSLDFDLHSSYSVLPDCPESTDTTKGASCQFNFETLCSPFSPATVAPSFPESTSWEAVETPSTVSSCSNGCLQERLPSSEFALKPEEEEAISRGLLPIEQDQMIPEAAWNGPEVYMTVSSRPQTIFGFIQICEYYDHEQQEWPELLATPLEIGISPVLASLRRVLQTALDCFLPSLDINMGGSFGDDQEGMLTIDSPHEPLLNSTVHVISDTQLDNWESLPLLQSISSEQTCCLFIVTERRACQVFVDKPSGNFCLGTFVHIHTRPREFIGLFVLFILSSSCWDCCGEQGHQCERRANLFDKMFLGDRQELSLTFWDAFQESKGLEILPKEVTLAPIIHQPIPVPVLQVSVPWIDRLDEMRQEGCSSKQELVESPDSYPPDSAMGDSYEAFIN